jgi:hypothetical protein
MGADGVNPIAFLILVGESDRQWLEPHYFDSSAIQPLGKLRVIVPKGPDDPNSLLDACIAFYPEYFSSCPSLGEVRAALGNTSRLDFHLGSKEIPSGWARLREEARPLLRDLNLWRADLERLHPHEATTE